MEYVMEGRECSAEVEVSEELEPEPDDRSLSISLFYCSGYYYNCSGIGETER